MRTFKITRTIEETVTVTEETYRHARELLDLADDTPAGISVSEYTSGFKAKFTEEEWQKIDQCAAAIMRHKDSGGITTD